MPVKIAFPCCMFLVSTVFCNLVHADSITMSTGTTEAFPTLGALNGPITGQNGSLAFWANHSVDGLTDPNNIASAPRQNSQLNIGNFLTGTCGSNAVAVGSCPAGTFNGMTTPTFDPNTLTYLGNGLAPVSSFYFTRDGSNAYTIDANLVFTANTVQFGWYDSGNPNSLNPIFSGMSENQSLPGNWSLANIPMGTNYGFYATVNYGNGYLATYYTESQYNSFTPMPNFTSLLGADAAAGSSKQHFALFQSGQNYAVAVEDGVGSSGYEGMGDYQDGVFTIALSTPEPSTFALAALALAGTFSRQRWFCKRA